MSFQPQGTVYGTLMNFQGEWDALGDAMQAPPYKAPPQSPVLYVKTANTFAAHDAAIRIPAGFDEVEIGASVAMVMGDGGGVDGYVLVNDIRLPQDSFFRPPVQANCRDGFLAIGERVRPRNEAGDPAIFVLQVKVNDALVQTVRFSHLRRPAAQLLADVGSFMTLGAGDLLLLGCDAPRPRARAGDRVEISMPALGRLANTFVAEAA
jgi:5-oxopent-3-ene-1,2,5-tricarboxylate decarboxylase/2-hydroxyhepta-2,4-diene-1,7-dioate isomerase